MRKQQYEVSARIAMVALLGIVISLTALIAIGKSDIVDCDPVIGEAITQEPIIWTPSHKEQLRMDSLYNIDAATKADIDSIRVMIDAILDKLE